MNAERIAELRALAETIAPHLAFPDPQGMHVVRTALPEALDAIERVRELAQKAKDAHLLMSDERFEPTNVIGEFAVLPDAILAALEGKP